MKKYLFLTCFIFLILAEPVLASFKDVPDDHVYVTAISWLKKNGVIQGYADGTFKPDQEVNRAEFVKMLYTAKGENGMYMNKPIQPFIDVEGGEWYGGYVTKAYMAGIIDGYSDGTFRPGNPINMAEAVKIVINGFFKDKNLFEAFKDLSSCEFNNTNMTENMDEDVWYYKYIHFADGICSIPDNMVSGKDFDPGKNLTRGQMAELLYRTKSVFDNSVVAPADNYVSDLAIFKDYEIEPKAILALCTGEPEVLDSGRSVYPIDPKYAHLSFLGQVFTADDCGKDRLNKIFGVEDDNYTLGVSLFTDGPPSENLFQLLKDMNYQCPQAVSLNKCTMWIWSSEPLKIEDILKLKPYAEEFTGDDCIDCG